MKKSDESEPREASGLFLGSEPLSGMGHERKAVGHGDDNRDVGGPGGKDTGDDDSGDDGDTDSTDKGGDESRDADGKD